MGLRLKSHGKRRTLKCLEGYISAPLQKHLGERIFKRL